MKKILTPMAAAILAGVPAVSNAMEKDYSTWPSYNGDDLEMTVDSNSTRFALWSPEAQAVNVLLYPTDRNSEATDTQQLFHSFRQRAAHRSGHYGRILSGSRKSRL